MFGRSRKTTPPTQTHDHRPVTEAQVVQNLIECSLAGTAQWSGVVQGRIYTLTGDGRYHVCFKAPQRLLQLSQGPSDFFSADVCIVLTPQQSADLTAAIGDVADDGDDSYYEDIRALLLSSAAEPYTS